jgi:DNA-binding winged helix-turn-helix (wHTH) protein
MTSRAKRFRDRDYESFILRAAVGVTGAKSFAMARAGGGAPQAMLPAMALVFADCELDEALYALRRRGRPVKIEPKVFDVLLHLLRHRERVVAKNELLDALWPGEAVSDSVLPRAIAAARRAVGDTRSRAAVIETVHGRGYRFVADVVERAAAPRVEQRKGEAVAVAEPPGDGSAFVGREAAMAPLRAALAEAASSRGRVVLLAGEPGIGKTRTLAELGREARERGMRWLEGRCYEGEGAPAFWPWAQVLRALFADAGPQLEAELGPAAGDVAELVPELRARSPRLPARDDAGSDQARFRVFDSVSGVIVRAARRTPLALAIDDLHWGDADSLQLFGFLADAVRGAPVLLLGAYRDVEVRRDRPLARLLGTLASAPHAARVELRGLEPAAVSELVASVAGAPAKPEVAAAVAQLSEGNPFFAHEIVRLLADEGRLDGEAGGLSELALPQGVRDAVGRRLDGLSPECNELLRAAAVVGRQFDVSVLEAVSGEPREPLLEELGEALAAGVVVEAEAGVGRFAFAHALIQQTLHEELSVPQRVSLHRRAAEALEAAYGERPDAPAAALAHHFFEAAPAGGAERAVLWSERAAAQALALFAYAESARQLARALEALDHVASPDAARRCALLVRLGEARWAAGDREGGRAQLASAAELAQTLGRDDLFARAAVGYRGVGEMGMPPDAKTLALLELARARLGEDAPALRARVLARLAGTPPYSLRMATRDELAREAWALAQRSGDAEALADALGARYWATLGPDRSGERLEVAAEARSLAARTGDRSLEGVAAEIALGVHLLRGDLAAADRELDNYSRLSDELRRPVFRLLATAARAARATLAGDFTQAERLIQDAIAAGRGSVPFADVLFAGYAFWVLYQRGELSRVGRQIAETAALFQRRFAGSESLLRLVPLVGHVLGGSGEQARRDFEAFAAADFDDLERDEHWMVSMSLLASAAVVLRDRRRAGILYARLLPFRHLAVSHDLMRCVAGSAEHPLGQLALVLERPADAVAHFEAALAQERAMGAGPACVRSALGLASALLARGAAGDRETAARAQDEALALAARLGVTPPEPLPLPRLA